MAFTQVQVQGQWMDRLGNPEGGTFTATPSAAFTNGGVTAQTVTVPIVNGSATLNLFATDDLGTSPSGAVWTLIVKGSSGAIHVLTTPLLGAWGTLLTWGQLQQLENTWANPVPHAGPWSQQSPFGAGFRSSTDIFISTYDTNPATTDHTTIFQNAIAAAAGLVVAGYSKVRIILDTRQKYTLGGAVQAGANNQLAQVPLPFHDNTDTGTIELVGIPRGNDYTYISSGQSGTVIESTLTSAPTFSSTTGIASIFGGPASFRASPGTYPSEFSYLKFATQDITIRSANPVICGIDAGWITGFSWQGLLSFDTDYLATQGIGYTGMTPCTNPQAIPIIFPFNLDWYGTTGDRLVVAGWAGGPYLGEYLDCRSITVFATPGACLNLDAANQVSRIDYLTDWNNAYGIATLDGNFTATTPVSPTATAAGSRRTRSNGATGTYASPVDIGVWEIQKNQGGSMSASLNRVNDLLDANNFMVVDGSFIQTDDAGNNNVGNLAMIGTGGSATGALVKVRLRNRLAPDGPSYVNAAGSAVAQRNPIGRDCLVQVAATGGGQVISAITVNGNAVWISGQPTIALVPASAVISITYAGGTSAPTLAWTAV